LCPFHRHGSERTRVALIMQVPLQRPLHAHAMFDVALRCGSDLVQRRLMLLHVRIE
jgi:hypothetical protein